MLPFVRLSFQLHGVQIGSGSLIFGMPIIQRHSDAFIIIGNNFGVRGWPGSNPIIRTGRCVLSARLPGARLQIGNQVGISGTSLVCEKSITIGNRVRIGANSIVIDTDFHSLSAEVRSQDPNESIKRPVIIDDDVFIGMNCIVLKGTTIGKGSVIGAGSVVSGNIPENSLAVGNPAKVVRALN